MENVGSSCTHVHVQITPGLGACAIYEHVMMGKLPCNPHCKDSKIFAPRTFGLKDTGDRSKAKS